MVGCVKTVSGLSMCATLALTITREDPHVDVVFTSKCEASLEST